MFIYVILSDCIYKYKCINNIMEMCNRDKWIEGIWTFLIGFTLFLSCLFGTFYGQKFYSFASDKRLQAE